LLPSLSWIQVWDAEQRRELPVLRNTEYLWGVTFSPDGKSIVSGHARGMVRVRDIVDGKELASFRTRPDGADPHTEGADLQDPMRSPRVVHLICFSPDGTLLATGAADRVTLWDVATAFGGKVASAGRPTTSRVPNPAGPVTHGR
jgi:WD40 repeat protein